MTYYELGNYTYVYDAMTSVKLVDSVCGNSDQIPIQSPLKSATYRNAV